MNKYLASLVLVLLPGILPAQKIFWSDISREDIIKASEISRSFLKHLEKQRVDSMEVFLMHDSVYVGDGTWLPEYVFLEKLMEQTRGIPLQNVKLTGYRFDDFLEQFEQHKILEKVYPVFDNHSILIQADYPGNRTGEQITLVLKNENGRWTITGLNGFGLSPGQPAGPVPAELGFRIEKIPEAGIVMPIPVDFSKPERVEGQVIFNLEDKTERDAVFQVLIDEYKTKVHYYTY
ncbi:MAG: hypothetical protein KFF73_07585, partial [Cyclobacteriaceae bacterium]|nr:hypothetical protein [Cyclobacteriaceae bacterium]